MTKSQAALYPGYFHPGDRFPHVLIYSTALAVLSLGVVGMITKLI